ncbi:hypothetical protein H8356DRAFT_1330331 [Neocallimastix lanati (nom. inval.)]|nr:hypothetical protein H8356DRAFT_1330331 [Neocallimastix sp. JGI-2020a]
MNIDISELNDLNDNINEDNEKNKNNEENNEIIDINDDRNNDINKKIYSWKTILRDFKEASSGNSQHVKGKNANSGNLLDISAIDLIPCHETIKISKLENLKDNKHNKKIEQPLLPNMSDYFISNTNNPL